MYPQPHSSQSVLAGQEAFRLYTALQSNGDIYEIDTSIKSLVIGPNSDIQNARAYYYDPTIPGSVQTALISVNDPYVTRMDALMGTPVENLGTMARILVSSDDMVPHPDQEYLGLSQLYQEGDLVYTYPPFIDIMGYHRDPPAFPQTRAERRWDINVTVLDRGEGSGYSFYAFPGYRRRYFHVKGVQLVGFPGAPASTLTLLGVTFTPGASGGVWASTHPLGAVTLTSAFDTAQLIYYANQEINLDGVAAALDHTSGLFDYYMVAVGSPAIDGGAQPGIVLNVIATDCA